jgi:hypothetical protein
MKLLKNSLLLLIIVLQLEIKAQFVPISFNDYVPNWIHYFQDTAAIGYYNKHPDGMTHLFHSPKIIHSQGNNFYFLYHIYVNSISSDGAYLEKMDLNNKRTLWSNYFDIRNSERYESPSNFFINDTGEIEIIGYRKKDNGLFTRQSKFFRRTYNADHGYLTSHNFSSEIDTLAPWIYSNQGWSSSQIIKIQNNYIHNSVIAFDHGPELQFSRLFYELDSIGKKLNETFFIGERHLKYNLSGPQLIKLDEDEYVNTYYSINTTNTYSDTFKYKLFLQYFNDSFELYKEFDISEIIRIKDGAEFYVKYTDDKNIILVLLESYEPALWHTVFYIFNHSGELIDSFPFITKDGERIIYMDIEKVSDSEFLLAGSSQWHQKGVKNTVHFYLKELNKNLKYLNSFEIEEENHFLKAEGLVILDNHDVLYLGSHRYSNFEGVNFVDDKGGGQKCLIHFEAQDIGLVSNKNISSVSSPNNIIIYPKPAFNTIWVKLKFTVEGKLIINNMQGVEMFSTKFNSDNMSIHIDNLKSGFYSLTIINKNGNRINSAIFQKSN